jgi:phosphopantothenoylcysteine synthetase/decarboxylase
MSKNIVLIISASIAAYKALDIIRGLIKKECNVECILTKNASEFITPLSVQTLSNNKVYTDMFAKTPKWDIEHISLAKKANAILIAPASANIIALLACGMADDLATSVVLASKAKVLIAPAMNSNMYSHKAVSNNLETLKSYGYKIIEPQKGKLACGDIGEGKLASIEHIIDETLKEI